LGRIDCKYSHRNNNQKEGDKMIQDNSSESVCRADDEYSENGMNEKRQHRRFNVENMEVDCDIPSASRVKVMNISSGGALVMVDKFINIGKSYALKIGYKDKSVFVKALVVWALLADSVKEANGDITPLFIAGMQFIDVIKGEIPEIIRLLEANVEGTMYDAFMGSLQGNTYN
jgi:hypothetical protein